MQTGAFLYHVMYFANDGGPLLLAPVTPRPFWEGGEVPANGRVVEAESRTLHDVATDYDRACDVSDGAAILSAGQGWVVAVGGEVGSAAWLRLDRGTFVLVGVDAWRQSPTAATVKAHYEILAAGPWTMLAPAALLEEGGIELLHAAGIPGTDTRFEFSEGSDEEAAVIGDSILYPAEAGSYAIEFFEHVRRRTAETPGEYAVLIRFTKRQ